MAKGPADLQYQIDTSISQVTGIPEWLCGSNRTRRVQVITFKPVVDAKTVNAREEMMVCYAVCLSSRPLGTGSKHGVGTEHMPMTRPESGIHVHHTPWHGSSPCFSPLLSGPLSTYTHECCCFPRSKTGAMACMCPPA